MNNLGFWKGELIGAVRVEAARQRGDVGKTFDWDKAAQIIKERAAMSAEAGLGGDWDYTGGKIWYDGKPVDADDTYTYLASAWATPQLIIDDDDPIDCYIPTPEAIEKGWDANTYWPNSALAIVQKGNNE